MCVPAKSKPQDALLYAKFLAEVKAGLIAAAQKDKLHDVSLLGASLGQSSRWRVTADASASAEKVPIFFNSSSAIIQTSKDMFACIPD